MQWKGLALEEPPWWSWLPLSQVSMIVDAFSLCLILCIQQNNIDKECSSIWLTFREYHPLSFIDLNYELEQNIVNKAQYLFHGLDLCKYFSRNKLLVFFHLVVQLANKKIRKSTFHMKIHASSYFKKKHHIERWTVLISKHNQVRNFLCFSWYYEKNTIRKNYKHVYMTVLQLYMVFYYTVLRQFLFYSICSPS